MFDDAISYLILSDVPLSRVPSALCEPELFIIAPSDRVSKVKAVSLTISAPTKVIVTLVPIVDVVE